MSYINPYASLLLTLVHSRRVKIQIQAKRSGLGFIEKTIHVRTCILEISSMYIYIYEAPFLYKFDFVVNFKFLEVKQSKFNLENLPKSMCFNLVYVFVYANIWCTCPARIIG